MTAKKELLGKCSWIGSAAKPRRREVGVISQIGSVCGEACTDDSVVVVTEKLEALGYPCLSYQTRRYASRKKTASRDDHA